MSQSHKRRLRIGYVSKSDPDDKKAWSGTIYHMKVALEMYCGEVVALGPVVSKLKLIAYHIDRGIFFLFGKKLNLERSRWVSKEYDFLFRKKIKAKRLDLLFSPNPIEIAYLDTDLPVIYTKDSTGFLMQNYVSRTPYFQWGYFEWNMSVGRALSKASLIVLPTDWAAASVVNDYKTDSSKIHIAPYGANILNVPKKLERYEEVSKICRLLFVGVDWKWKGGEIAYSAMQYLHTLGLPAHLTICGCVPSQDVIDDNRVTWHKFLDKGSPDDLDLLVDLYKTSHFLVFPTRAECYGIVVCEASAFGTPTIATDTGGVSGVVTNGSNGYLLPHSAGGEEYAAKILQIFSNRESYYKLCKSSRKQYEEKLNWHVWGQTVAKRIESLNLSD